VEAIKRTKVPDADLSPLNFGASIKKTASLLNEGCSFLITTHLNPDADGIGSMLALGKSLLNADKEVVLWTEAPIRHPNNRLKGAGSVVQHIDPERDFDGVVVLDCADIERAGHLQDNPGKLKPLINIDHHETNTFFGDLNLVDVNSSSTGELIFKVIKLGGFPVDRDIAGNIFAAIQADTGSFRYNNTSPTCLRIAAEMMDHGANPWKISREVMDGYDLSRLRLLEMALGTLEFHHAGQIGMMTIFLWMFSKAGADPEDSERFVDYPRFVSGVEIAVLIRQTGEHDYKFSLRSNGGVNVAQLANQFGGGGHANAAGIDCHGSIESLKGDLLRKAVQLLDGIPN
jgi:phosphoesterase RecJ-like protein